LPKQLKEHGLSVETLAVSENTLRKIIRQYTSEAGVRNLERPACFHLPQNRQRKLCARKSVLWSLCRTLNKYLGMASFRYGLAEKEDEVGVATGLAWTETGGDTLVLK
jgi:ATP-dependent Lon protease